MHVLVSVTWAHQMVQFYTLPETILEVENQLFVEEKGHPTGHLPLP